MSFFYIKFNLIVCRSSNDRREGLTKTLMMLMAVVAFCVSMPLAAHALTFKKGQVLGSDGQIYDGASPAEIAKLISVAK